jgi:hypothetical protein
LLHVIQALHQRTVNSAVLVYNKRRLGIGFSVVDLFLGGFLFQ